MGTHLEKSPSVNYGDTFGKIAKYKLWGHIWISIKKLRHVTPPVQAKALQLLHAKAFEPLKLNDQYVRPPAQAQLKLRTFW